MTNILKAIINIVEQPIHKIEEFYVTKIEQLAWEKR